MTRSALLFGEKMLHNFPMKIGYYSFNSKPFRVSLLAGSPYHIRDNLFGCDIYNMRRTIININ